jgi:hypothetical protein
MPSRNNDNESPVLLYATSASAADTPDAAPGQSADAALKVPLLDDVEEIRDSEPQTGAWKSYNGHVVLWDVLKDPPTARIVCPGGCGSIPYPPLDEDEDTANYYYSPSGCNAEYVLCSVPSEKCVPEEHRGQCRQNPEHLKCHFAVCLPFRLICSLLFMVCDLVSIILLGHSLAVNVEKNFHVPVNPWQKVCLATKCTAALIWGLSA